MCTIWAARVSSFLEISPQRFHSPPPTLTLDLLTKSRKQTLSSPKQLTAIRYVPGDNSAGGPDFAEPYGKRQAE